MTLSEICIKRPVLATVMSLVLIVFGIVGYHYLPTRYLPQFETPIVNVFTSFPSASPELVESLVTTPLEDALRGVPGIETISSTSTQGSSKIHIRLSPGADKTEATNDIRNKVSQARFKLPKSIDPPVVSSGWDDSDFIDVAITSTTQTPQQVYDYVSHYLQDQVEDIDGIASTDFTGATDYVIRVYVDPDKLAAFKLPITSVTDALQSANVHEPAGSIQGSAVTIPLDINSQLKSVKQFNNLVIAKKGHTQIHISDIGVAKLESQTIPPDLAYYDGKPALYWEIYNATDANPIAAAHKVLRYFKMVKDQLPAGMQIHVLYNQAQFMQQSINEVYFSLSMAVICVMVILFLFLGAFRASFIPMVTIPVCIIATFGVIYSLGFTINIITLLALVLAIGLVVDDAIVVLENIYRHLEEGLNTFKAALIGSKEITFAVIAMTLTLAAVYAPIGLVHGRTSTIFKSFAFTLSSAVIISGFVALTLTPMMCAQWLRPGKELQLEKRYGSWLDRIFDRLIHSYQKMLSLCLNKKLIFVILALTVAISGYWLFKSVPKAFIPHDDQGLVIAFMKSSKDVSPTYLRPLIHKAQTIIDNNPNVANSMAVAWASGSFNAIFIQLKPLDKRKLSSTNIATQLNKALKTIPGLNMRAFASSFGDQGHSQLSWMLQTTDSYTKLATISAHIVDKLAKYPGLTMVTNDLSYDSAEYKVNINRNLANALGVSISQIDQVIATFVGGNKVTTLNQSTTSYDVYVQAQRNRITDPLQIESLLLNVTENGKIKQIPLSDLITIKRVASQDTLSHYNHLRSAQFSAQLSPGYTLGQVVSYLQTALPKLLPGNVQFSFKGKAKNILDSSHNMNFIFLLAFIFIYLVLSALFESFIDPFIILLVVPLSIVAALAALKIAGGTLNIYTNIGLVTLVGLIAKHGILITQFANRCLEKGASIQEALLDAGAQRLRPILMTTAAMIFGALPLVFAGGSSAESRFQIGLVIIAGLFFGTFFSLIIVPIAFALCKRQRVL